MSDFFTILLINLHYSYSEFRIQIAIIQFGIILLIFLNTFQVSFLRYFCNTNKNVHNNHKCLWKNKKSVSKQPLYSSCFFSVMAPLPCVEALAAGGSAQAEVLPWTQDNPQPGQVVYSS